MKEKKHNFKMEKKEMIVVVIDVRKNGPFTSTIIDFHFCVLESREEKVNKWKNEKQMKKRMCLEKRMGWREREKEVAYVLRLTKEHESERGGGGIS